MNLHIAENDAIDIRQIEDFLLQQDGVVDAAVWVKNNALLAQVTVTGDLGLDETDLRGACERELGPGMTPAMILLQRALRPAA